MLELDELWTFVGRKVDKRWIWIALARHSRQVVAYAIGDRSERTCRRLWERIPESYKGGCCYSDFWEAYRAVIPEERHEAVGKESAELASMGLGGDHGVAFEYWKEEHGEKTTCRLT